MNCGDQELAELVAAAQAIGGFGTLYIDPPWQYGNQSTRNGTDDKYRTMPLAWIESLPVHKLAAERAHLHMWTTVGFLEDSLRLLRIWGFEFKGYFEWCKPQMGMGNYYRISKEPLLLGVRGGLRPPKGAWNVKDWAVFNRQSHSAKPPEVRAMIERISPRPRVELFSRAVTQGWVPWGDEIAATDFYRALADECL